MTNSSTDPDTSISERVEITQMVEAGEVTRTVEPYENRAIEAFYLDPYLVGLLAARPCEAPTELPPPGLAFA